MKTLTEISAANNSQNCLLKLIDEDHKHAFFAPDTINQCLKLSYKLKIQRELNFGSEDALFSQVKTGIQISMTAKII